MPQSLSCVIVHVTFSAKYRRPVLNEEIRGRLFPYLGGVLRNLKCPPIQVGGYEDHVHLLFSQARTLSMAKIIEYTKVPSTKWIKENWPEHREFAWQDGYGVFSCGIREVETLKRYIQNQPEHHKRESFQDEFRRLCREFGVELDERYVWD